MHTALALAGFLALAAFGAAGALAYARTLPPPALARTATALAATVLATGAAAALYLWGTP